MNYITYNKLNSKKEETSVNLCSTNSNALEAEEKQNGNNANKNESVVENKKNYFNIKNSEEDNLSLDDDDNYGNDGYSNENYFGFYNSNCIEEHTTNQNFELSEHSETNFTNI